MGACTAGGVAGNAHGHTFPYGSSCSLCIADSEGLTFIASILCFANPRHCLRSHVVAIQQTEDAPSALRPEARASHPLELLVSSSCLHDRVMCRQPTQGYQHQSTNGRDSAQATHAQTSESDILEHGSGTKDISPGSGCTSRSGNGER